MINDCFPQTVGHCCSFMRLDIPEQISLSRCRLYIECLKVRSVERTSNYYSKPKHDIMDNTT